LSSLVVLGDCATRPVPPIEKFDLNTILFHGATFADLDRRNGPLVVAQATDISSGRGRLLAICFRLPLLRPRRGAALRAAAASSAVPCALSPVTINNYGGSCKFAVPPWVQVFSDSVNSSSLIAQARPNSDISRAAREAKSPKLPQHRRRVGLHGNLR
jgi:hypothetical protein